MRQFISHSAPDSKGLLRITGQDFRYLKLVLRISTGDMVSVRVPGGKLVNMTVSKINPEERLMILQVCSENKSAGEEKCGNGVQASVIESEAQDTEYFLFQFIAKPVKMETIIRQATECGVRYIIPVIGEFSQKSSIIAMEGSEDSAKRERFLRIIKEARQQSGSPVQTEVLKAMTLEEACSFWEEKTSSLSPEEKLSVALWERNENSVRIKKAVSGKKIKACALAVGSEGGISPDEIEILNGRGFSTVHFEGNILRCETASLYGIAAVQTAIREENE